MLLTSKHIATHKVLYKFNQFKNSINDIMECAMPPYLALLNAIKYKKVTILSRPRGWTLPKIEAIRERDNHTCQICGAKQKDRALHVHHIDGNRYNCKSENLITVCPKCHPLVEGIY